MAPRAHLASSIMGYDSFSAMHTVLCSQIALDKKKIKVRHYVVM